jgi:hypothetical protein
MTLKKREGKKSEMQGSVVDSAVGLPFLNLSYAPAPYSQHPLFIAAGSQSSCYVPRVYHLGLAVEEEIDTKESGSPSASVADAEDPSTLSPGPSSSAAVPQPHRFKVSQRCVVVAYESVLVLDGPSATAALLSVDAHKCSFAEAGGIHAVALSDSVLSESMKLTSVVLSEEDPTWFAILGDGTSQHRDIVVQLPVESEATGFLKCISTLFFHHNRRDLPVTVVDSVEELRHRGLLGTKKKHLLLQRQQQPPLPANGLISRQLWSVSNLDVPFVQDRLGFVKDTFAAIEKEMKADLVELERNMVAAMRKVDLRLSQQKIRADEFEQMRRAHQEREAGLQAKQQELAQALQLVHETEQKHDRMKMELVAEAQSWRDVFQQRLSEELKKRQRLAHLQERRANSAEQGKRDLADLQTKISLFEAKIGEYGSNEYLSLVKERDATMDVVKQLTEELAAAKKETGYPTPVGISSSSSPNRATPSPSQSRSSSKRSVSLLSTASTADPRFDAEALSTNSKLRSLLEKCRADMMEQEASHIALAEDLQAFTAECSALQEEELLFECKRKQQEQRRQQLLAASNTTELLLEKQRELIKELKAEPRFYIERQRLKTAIERRKILEAEVDKAKAVRVAALNELQQEVFAERLRVMGLAQRVQ